MNELGELSQWFVVIMVIITIITLMVSAYQAK